jgi:hypothetical protein
LLKTADGESINCYRYSFLEDGTLFPINEINGAVGHLPLSKGGDIKEGGDTEEDTTIPVMKLNDSLSVLTMP